MIAAVGRFEPAALRRSLVLMAANDNPAHDHEYRSRGASFRHTDGWGMTWTQDGRLHTRSANDLGAVGRLGGAHRSAPDRDVLLLHARKATPPGSISTMNTHPLPRHLPRP